MAAETADMNEKLREELELAMKQVQIAFRKGLQDMKSRRQLTAEAEPGELAMFVTAAIQGGLLLSKTAKSIAPLKSTLKNAMSHLKSFER